MNRWILPLALVSALAWAQEAPVSAPVIGSGIDVKQLSASIRPQDDFYRYANGPWLDKADIGRAESSVGAFAALRTHVRKQITDVIEQIVAMPDKAAGSDVQKISDWYTSYADMAQRDKLGYKPLTGELHAIVVLKDKRGLPPMLAHLSRIGVDTPYVVRVSADEEDAGINAVHLEQSGLGLPDRDYYLNHSDPRFDKIRTEYVEHIAKMLGLVGAERPREQAQAVLALETALAQAQIERSENRDPHKRFNKMAVSKLDELAPGYDWKGAMGASGVAGRTDMLVVAQPTYLKALPAIVDSTDLETWKSYLTWQLLHAYADLMSSSFADSHLAFYGKVLSGLEETAGLKRRAIASTERAFGNQIGRIYVEGYVNKDSKPRVEAMVQNILATYRERITSAAWLSEATRKEALSKLDKLSIRVAWPEHWPEASRLDVQAGDPVGNRMRQAMMEKARSVARIGRPVNRNEWSTTPQTVNAFYSANRNSITLPAGILQPPFFDPAADDAVNYGAIGAVIGHEISHGFDDKGSQFDADGNLREWWTPEDRANYLKRAGAIEAQYGAFSPLPGYTINGSLTLGENIADNAGLAIAFAAWQRSLQGKPAPLLDGLTGEQRFFLGFARIYRGKQRPEAMIRQLKSDTHSPGEFRTNGSLRNQAPFYEAFGLKAGDKMYLAPAERVSIW